ncbi:hypothetical protein GCM10027088_60910 [Nocardia goodfellowii]
MRDPRQLGVDSGELEELGLDRWFDIQRGETPERYGRVGGIRTPQAANAKAPRYPGANGLTAIARAQPGHPRPRPSGDQLRECVRCRSAAGFRFTISTGSTSRGLTVAWSHCADHSARNS